MTTSRMMAKVVISITLLLMCLLPQACSTSENPLDPQPISSGTLEVSISVTGTRPDPDGYTVAVSVNGQGPLAPQRVESTGGMVRFPDLPTGTHSVRLESLAANCSVEGANRRPFTIVAGGTLQIGFTVSCPGPGTVLLKTVTTGDDPDPDGYTVIFEGSSTRKVQIGANDSLLISEENLPPGSSWVVRLDEIAANCRRASPNLALRLEDDSTTSVEFLVECMGWSAFRSAGIYERVSPHISGILSERYVLFEDGTFWLRFASARWGVFEYPGTYSRGYSVIMFAFDADSRWHATGNTRSDNCFVVEYNLDMLLSDFEDGVYCQSSGM